MLTYSGAVRRRVRRLERATGAVPGDWCECPGDGRVVVDWGDGSAEPDVVENCPRCGKPIRVVAVEWPDNAGVLDD